jgi:transposase-like protein
LNNQVQQIKNELEESQRQAQKQALVEMHLKDELEHAKSQFVDMQRAERAARVDLEQAKRHVYAYAFASFTFFFKT